MNYTEQEFPSTTFAWRKVKIQAPPRPQGTARAKRARQALPLSENRAKPVNQRDTHGVLIKYRGGAECFWELSFQGRTVRVPGWWQLHDALQHLYLPGGLKEDIPVPSVEPEK